MARRSDHSRDELHRMALDTARRIVAEHGLSGLTTRKIVQGIGYTVGTLYQVFRSVDDLIEQMNAETLEELHAACASMDFGSDPAESLRALTTRYAEYSRAHPRLWSAIFDHRLPQGYERGKRYEDGVRGLMALVERAVAPLFGPGEERERQQDAHMLWGSYYGFSALANSGRMSAEASVEGMTERLIGIYLAARALSGLQAASGMRTRRRPASKSSSAKGQTVWGQRISICRFRGR